MKRAVDRTDAVDLDHRDPLAPLAERFTLPPGILYLDGNSLGPPPVTAAARIEEVVRREWGQGLIRSWTEHGWIDLPRRVAAKIARLVGAGGHEVAVADSTSVNLFKLLAAALELAPGRTVILSERGNFPTDLYMMQGIERLLGPERCRLRVVDDAATAIDDEVALVALSHVDYTSGRRRDLAAITAAAHRAGALALWDLAHSAGALPIGLDDAGVDLAVGCGYKFLNGGPGAPAFLFIAERHHRAARSPLAGWLGAAEPFAFDPEYRPAPGIDRFLCGTPPILSLAALECGVDLALEADLEAVRAKSMALGELFLARAAARLAAHGFAPACPAEARDRGSQVCLRHREGLKIVQALAARGVIGDFRPPDVLRFGLAPLYLGYADVWDAVEILAEVMESGSWRDPRFAAVPAVT